MNTKLDELKCLAREFRSVLDARFSGDRSAECQLPSKEDIATFCWRYFDSLFPLHHMPEESRSPQAAHFVDELETLLAEQIVSAIRFDYKCRSKKTPENLAPAVDEIVGKIREKLPNFAHLQASDLQAALKNDPAASGLEEILLSYPGIVAITVQRLAHELYQLKVPYLPRIMTEIAHSRTGIDIHPGARIDESFFIDHGTGVVIGETATIGKNVTLYHGVTLGAFNPTSQRDSNGGLVRGSANKRHPDIEDGVTIYPGATILGGNTRIGHHSIVGGNVWLTHSVVPYSRVTVKDPELLIRSHTRGTEEDWFLGSSI